MEELDFVSIVSIVNMLLSGALFFIYVRNYKVIKSNFCIGLMIFASFFLIQNATALYFQLSMVMYYTKEVADVALILNLLETLGLGVFLYLTAKPS